MENYKKVYLSGGSEEGLLWELIFSCRINTTVFSGGFIFHGENKRKKNIIRGKDKQWVMRNIPSSIWWMLEIHHDWEHGARMYLLTKEEHKKRK